MSENLTPAACDALHSLVDDALLGKSVRTLLDSGGVSEILHDAITAHLRYGNDRYEFTTYVDTRLRQLLPLERTVHEHSS